MDCAEALRVQAYFDGELDAADAAAAAQHLGGCARCQAMLADLAQARAALRSAPDIRAPAALRARVSALLDADEERSAASVTRAGRSRPFWLGAFAGLGVSSLVAALIVFVMLPAATSPFVDGILSAHLRSLTPDHLIAVVASEQHTVKPWFAGRADVSPTVADFAARGFTLAGGRVDSLPGERAAVLVYRHGRHVVNVFSWADRSAALPRATTRNGYRLLFWRAGDVAYCAVSDTTWDELSTLAALLQAQSAAEQRLAPQ